MRVPLLRALFVIAGLASLLVLPASADDPVDVQSGEIGFSRVTSLTMPSGLASLGGVVLTSPDDNFGGLSGLDVSSDGKSFLAVSDRGYWLTGDFVYRDGKLTGVANTRMAPIRNTKGVVDDRKSRSDAEAVAAWSDKGIGGKVVVGFERKQRVEQFDLGRHGLAAPAEHVRLPDQAADGETNGELEALGRFHDGPLKGWLIGISERNETRDGKLRGWLWRKGRTHEFHITRLDNYRITGLAILPGSKEIITVERLFEPPFGVGMAMRRFTIEDLQNQDAGSGAQVFEGRITSFRIDNMEGIAAHTDERGTVITVISDDNFNRSVQSTVMFQFRLDDN